MANTIFYARVSTKDQKLDLQLDTARQLGVKTDNVFVEKASGARQDRPTLAKALAELKKGDTFACYKLDRVGRSLAHVSRLLADLEGRGVHFRSVADGLDTGSNHGKLVLHILGAIAQFERDLTMERIRAGIDAAKRRGKHMGRPWKWSLEMVRRARKLMNKDGLNADDTAKVLGVSRRTLFRGLRAADDHDRLAAAE